MASVTLGWAAWAAGAAHGQAAGLEMEAAQATARSMVLVRLSLQEPQQVAAPTVMVLPFLLHARVKEITGKVASLCQEDAPWIRPPQWKPDGA